MNDQSNNKIKLIATLLCCSLLLENITGMSFARAKEDSHWTKIKDQNCQVYDWSPKEGIFPRWTGSCQNGKAHGTGKLIWEKDGKPDSIDIGNWVNGKLEGATIQYTLNREEKIGTIEFVTFKENVRNGKSYLFMQNSTEESPGKIELIENSYNLTRRTYFDGSAIEIERDEDHDYTLEQAMDFVQEKDQESKNPTNSGDYASLLIGIGILAGGAYLVKEFFTGLTDTFSAPSATSTSSGATAPSCIMVKAEMVADLLGGIFGDGCLTNICVYNDNDIQNGGRGYISENCSAYAVSICPGYQGAISGIYRWNATFGLDTKRSCAGTFNLNTPNDVTIRVYTDCRDASH